MLRIAQYKNSKAMSLLEVVIALAIMGVLLTMAVPNFTKMRENAYKDKCITNLRRIAAAKEHWSLETGADDTDTPTATQLDPYIKNGTSTLVCTLDTSSSFATSYGINDMSTYPACKIEPGTHTLP